MYTIHLTKITERQLEKKNLLYLSYYNKRVKITLL